MFGILKSGIKLGIGCFVAIVLIVALVAGGIYYYWIKKPAAKPRNGNRRQTALSINRTGKPANRITYVSSRSIHFGRGGTSMLEIFSNKTSAFESVSTTAKYSGRMKPSPTA